ncbi:hypothetical protein LPJ61_004821 [Coemansia biformis]|uniref:Uncharacterized protein n=1 Tax=Coemansia biformis TaxID=1286918 RepID=A0A9W7YA18_9FUNG|nr:hypothetical protein LPJ61_004821 [Coemansia biformis]
MDDLYICGNTAMFGSIAEMSLPVVKQLVLQTVYNADDDTSVFRSINRIFVAARRSEERRLRISGDRLPFQLENIAFTGLTDLWTTAPTGVDEVFGCIRKLPLLTSLTIVNCTFGDIQTDITVPDSGEHEAIEPFKTRIQRLQLRMCRDSFVFDSAVMVVKYLLLRMPSVVRFATSDIPQQPIARFASKYSRQYPHLVNVVHILLDDD